MFTDVYSQGAGKACPELIGTCLSEEHLAFHFTWHGAHFSKSPKCGMPEWHIGLSMAKSSGSASTVCGQRRSKNEVLPQKHTSV